MRESRVRNTVGGGGDNLKALGAQLCEEERPSKDVLLPKQLIFESLWTQLNGSSTWSKQQHVKLRADFSILFMEEMI